MTKRTRLLAAVLATCGLLHAGVGDAVASDQSTHRAALLDGVESIAKPGIPGPIALTGKDAFAVMAGVARGGVRHAVVAAATHGEGRIVAFGHNGYLGPPTGPGQAMRLVANAVRWAGGERETVRVGLIGHGRLRTPLEKAGLVVSAVDANAWPEQLAEFDVLVTSSPDLGGVEKPERLLDFVARGGGLVTAGLAWGWMQLNPKASLLDDHALNAVLAPMGLCFTDGYIDRVLPAKDGERRLGDLTTRQACHAESALAWLELRRRPRNDTAQLSARDSALALQQTAVLTNAYRWLPSSQTEFRARVRDALSKAARPVVPSAEKPVVASDMVSRLRITIEHLDNERALPRNVVAADSATTFPGPVPAESPRIDRAMRLGLDRPGWLSTGLYAAPGEVITVTLPRTGVPGGLSLRIGAHTDRLWDKPEWKRHPEISRRWPLAPGTSEFASPHGGLIYIENPAAAAGRSLDVTIDGAVEAPRFVLGKTDPKEWRDRIRYLLAPWAELECDKLILTVPRHDAAQVTDPTDLMQFWDGVLDLYAELGRRPLADRPQRMVADRQISVGWLHAGYPIMMQFQHGAEALSLLELRGRPKTHNGAWGFWHELGHNHQRREWTFAGTTEVTCNLFSVFVDERVRGIKPAEHSWPAGKRKQVALHIRGDRSFARWKKSPGLALWFYLLIQEEFGWEPFQDVFEEYVNAPAAELPETDDEKRDQWLTRMSQRLGRNLGPYFEAWGVPTTAAARTAVADLPEWMPKTVKDALGE